MRAPIRFIVGCLVLLGIVGAAAAPVELANVFSDAELGYSIGYPSDWICVWEGADTVVFSGRAETDAYFTTVTVATYRSVAAGGSVEDVRQLITALKCDLVTGALNVCIDDSGFPAGDGFAVTFSRDGETFRQWRIAAARADGSAFHTWTYSAPTDLYDLSLPIADAMLDSWASFSPSGAASGTIPLSTTGAIAVLLEIQDRIHRLSTCNSDSDLSLDRCDRRVYSVTVPSSGFVALELVHERSEFVGAALYDAAGTRITFRAGNFADVYTSGHSVTAGVYQVAVYPESFTVESAFLLRVLFSSKEFSIEALEAQFGPRDQYTE